MLVVETIGALRETLAGARSEGKRIGFVPTMGFLHQGHLSLVDALRSDADVIVMSSFVNPKQFAPGEDFERYPRDAAHDESLAAGAGVDLMFVPSVEEMYGTSTDLLIHAGGLGTLWEGAVRPGHFDGVLTVVAKLFNIVGASTACFGQKDIQQVTLIRRMIREFNFPVTMLVAPIQRDADGLAMSSRNVYLTAEDRERALGLHRSLLKVEAAWRGGEHQVTALEALVRAELSATGDVDPDYVAIVDPETLRAAGTASDGTIVAIAARFGRTRLIDNCILGAGSR